VAVAVFNAAFPFRISGHVEHNNVDFFAI